MKWPRLPAGPLRFGSALSRRAHPVRSPGPAARSASWGGAPPLPAASRSQAAPGRTLRGEGESLYVAGPTGSVRASYFHAWFASSPAAAARLFLKEWS